MSLFYVLRKANISFDAQQGLLKLGSIASRRQHSLRVDPARLVGGLDLTLVKNSPEVLEYLEANFPESFQGHDQAIRTSSSSERPSEKADATDVRYPRNIRPISCFYRDVDGSRCSRYLRRNKMIPGILYGSDPTQGILSTQPQSKLLVQTEMRELQRELDRYHHHIESRVYDLTVFEHPEETQGTVHRVIPKNLQRHPVHGSQIYCINFLRYHAGRPIKVPISYANEEESPALKRDGFIVPIQRYVECFVEDGVDIPEKLELECTGLKLKDVIRTDRMVLPDGVRFSDRVTQRDSEFIIGVVFGRRRDAGSTESEA